MTQGTRKTRDIGLPGTPKTSRHSKRPKKKRHKTARGKIYTTAGNSKKM